MPLSIHHTFVALSDSEFTEYATALLGHYPSSEHRKQAVAYLQKIQSFDKATLVTERKLVRAKIIERLKKQDILDGLIEKQQFDFSRTSTLFSQLAVTDSDITTLLTQDNAEVYLEGHAFTGDMTITGDNVLIDGLGNGLSAKDGTLVNTATVAGDLIIAGSNAIIRGIDFTSSSDVAVRFTGDVVNVTVEQCKFAPGSGITDSEFWIGTGLEGNLILKNSYITGFTGVHLMDGNTGSNTPTKALKRVRIKYNYFKDNLGSIAIRGMESDPIKLVQYIDNKFEAEVNHASFWDTIESNNQIKLVVTGNTAVMAVGNDTNPGKPGFLQTWSRSDKPWTIKYSGNVLSNLKVGGKCASNSTFYAPNSADEDDFLIDVSSLHTNVTHAFSFKYKAESGDPGYPTASANKWLPAGNGVYRPENISVYPTPPTIINPSNYSLVV